MTKAAFNALNGEEMIEYIKEKIGEALERTGEFQKNLTFPLFQVTYKVTVASYPQQSLETEPKIKADGVIKRDDRPEGQIIDTLGDERVVAVEAKARVDTPDKAREEVGIPIPTPAPGPGGQVVDKGVVRGKHGRK